MNKIIAKKQLSADVFQFTIEAPRIAKKRKAGQFVVVRAYDKGERIPLTIADSDTKKGTITLVIQGLGKSTKYINALNEGDSILDVAGPLGMPTHVENFGTALIIGGGIGTAVAMPVAKALKDAGNKVITILGARVKDLVILEKELREISDELYIYTNDGSYGKKGIVTDPLREFISTGTKLDYVLAIGPLPMMSAVADTTRDKGIKTVVSLNPIMIDGTGMCGGCRITLDDGKTKRVKYVCVNGPEFDAHEVNFDELSKRLRTYKSYEKISDDNHKCKIGLDK